MSTEDEGKLNEFEQEWIQGEDAGSAPDKEAAAIVKVAQAAVAKADEDYARAHAEIESNSK